jgi:uncharacterized iron-regulated protein
MKNCLLSLSAAVLSIVFVGEHHNNESHHAAQLRLIKALHERKGRVAIGLEMFHAGHQEEIDSWLRGEMDTHDFIEVYYHNWSEPWQMYGDILIYARDNGLPLVALNASPDITSLVASHGFDSLTEEQLEELPGASCSIDADYEDFIRRALGEHEGDEMSFRRFCEAQMVWDTTMAYRTVRYLEENPEDTMVVLAGSGHSWKRGIPAQVRRQSRVSFTSVLPEVEDGLTRESVSVDDTDFLWLGI